MAVELLKRLINAKSTSETGELGSAEVLSAFFNKNNIDNEIDLWQNNRANIFAKISSTNEKPALLFASHLDVVPAGDDKWQYPPFKATEKDGKIFGRGSSDMKAGNAAIAVAAAEIAQSGVQLKGDLLIVSTAGEETDSCGAVRFVDKYCKNHTGQNNISGIILPEPTNFEIIVGHRGILWLKITTLGKTAHGSMPHLGVNAIENMNLLLNELYRYEPKPGAEKNALNQSGPSTISVNCIAGGKATNVIADKCSIEVDIRTTGQNKQDIINEIKAIFAKITEEKSNFRADIEIIRDVGPMLTEANHCFVQKLCRSSGISKTKIVNYTTDGPIFEKLNAPIVVFGPGKSEMAHQPNEYVDTADISKAVKIYKKVILDFLC